jgi:hypothetical protein
MFSTILAMYYSNQTARLLLDAIEEPSGGKGLILTVLEDVHVEISLRHTDIWAINHHTDTGQCLTSPLCTVDLVERH